VNSKLLSLEIQNTLTLIDDLDGYGEADASGLLISLAAESSRSEIPVTRRGAAECVVRVLIDATPGREPGLYIFLEASKSSSF